MMWKLSIIVIFLVFLLIFTCTNSQYVNPYGINITHTEIVGSNIETVLQSKIGSLNNFSFENRTQTGVYCSDLLKIIYPQELFTNEKYNEGLNLFNNTYLIEICTVEYFNNNPNDTNPYYNDQKPIVPPRAENQALYDSFIQQWKSIELGCTSRMATDFYPQIDTFTFKAQNEKNTTCIFFDIDQLDAILTPVPQLIYSRILEMTTPNPAPVPSYPNDVFTGKVYVKPSYTGLASQLSNQFLDNCNSFNLTTGNTLADPDPSGVIPMSCTSNLQLDLTVNNTNAPIPTIYNTTIFYNFVEHALFFFGVAPLPNTTTTTTNTTANTTTTEESVFVFFCIVDPYYPKTGQYYRTIYYHEIQDAIINCNTYENITRNIYLATKTVFYLNESLVITFKYENETLHIHGNNSFILCDACNTYSVNVENTRYRSFVVEYLNFVNTNGFFDFGNEQISSDRLDQQIFRSSETNFLTDSLKNVKFNYVNFYNQAPVLKLKYYPTWRNITANVYPTTTTLLSNDVVYDHETKYETKSKNLILWYEIGEFLKNITDFNINTNPNMLITRPLTKYKSIYRVLNFLYYNEAIITNCKFFGARDIAVLLFKNTNNDFEKYNGTTVFEYNIGQQTGSGLLRTFSTPQIYITNNLCNWYCGGQLEKILSDSMVRTTALAEITMYIPSGVLSVVDTPKQIVVMKNNNFLDLSINNTIINNPSAPVDRITNGNPLVDFFAGNLGFIGSFWIRNLNNNPNILISLNIENNYASGMPIGLRFDNFIADTSGTYGTTTTNEEHFIFTLLEPKTTNPSVLFYTDTVGGRFLRLVQYINSRTSDSAGLDVTINPPKINGFTYDGVKQSSGVNDIFLATNPQIVCNDYCVAGIEVECRVSYSFIGSENNINYANLTRALKDCPYGVISLMDDSHEESLVDIKLDERDFSGGASRKILIKSKSTSGRTSLIGQHNFIQKQTTFHTEIDITFQNINFVSPSSIVLPNQILFTIKTDPILSTLVQWKSLIFDTVNFVSETNEAFTTSFLCDECQVSTLNFQTNQWSHCIQNIITNLTNPLSTNTLISLNPISLPYGQYIYIKKTLTPKIDEINIVQNQILSDLSYFTFFRINSISHGILKINQNSFKWFNPLQWVQGKIFQTHPFGGTGAQNHQFISITDPSLDYANLEIQNNILNTYSLNLDSVPTGTTVTQDNLFIIKEANIDGISSWMGIQWYLPTTGITPILKEIFTRGILQNTMDSATTSTTQINLPTERNIAIYPDTTIQIQTGRLNVGIRISSDGFASSYLPCNAPATPTNSSQNEVRLLALRNPNTQANVAEVIFGDSFTFLVYDTIISPSPAIDVTCASCNDQCPEPDYFARELIYIYLFAGYMGVVLFWLFCLRGFENLYAEYIWRQRIQTPEERAVKEQALNIAKTGKESTSKKDTKEKTSKPKKKTKSSGLTSRLFKKSSKPKTKAERIKKTK